MPALDLQMIAQYSTLRIIESLAEGTVIFAFAALLLRLVPRQNAGTKSAIWFSALLAIAFAPVVTGIWSSQVAQSGMSLMRPAITVPDAWALYLFGSWAILAAWFLVGVGRALWHIRALKKSCAAVDSTALAPEIRQVLASASNGRVAKLCTSEQVRIPTAIGLLNPVIAVPRWVIDELAPAELKQVLIHEMAHLHRRDDWTNLVQQVVKAIFFFHPVVWWIEREVSLEREIACDDAVLAEIESPRAYAECLAHLAERTFIQRSIALAQAVLGKIRQTSTRVTQILDGNRPRGTRTCKPAVSLVAGFAIVFSIGASRFQRLIAFQDESPAQIARDTDPVGAGVGAAHAAFMDDAALHTTPSIKPTQARLVTRASEKPSATRRNPARRGTKPKVDGMIHLASLRDRIVPVQETVFVLVQSGANPDTESDDSSAIQMWRVTVLRYVVESSSNTIPRKQI
jgi:beta-lactamase regulating signal transducer with metallopeptidase domain